MEVVYRLDKVKGGLAVELVVNGRIEEEDGCECSSDVVGRNERRRGFFKFY